MDKAAIKGFIMWLESASDEAIKERKATVMDHLGSIHTQEGRADIKLALRLIDEEVLSRLELGRTSK